jgi:hypothetical protein
MLVILRILRVLFAIMAVLGLMLAGSARRGYED